MIKWFKRWFLGNPEIVKCGDLYLVRVKLLFISFYLGKRDFYKWCSVVCAIKYASFDNIDAAREHLNTYNERFEVIE